MLSVHVLLALHKSHLAGESQSAIVLLLETEEKDLVMSEPSLESFLPCFEELCAFSPNVCLFYGISKVGIPPPPPKAAGFSASIAGSTHLYQFLCHTDAGPQCFFPECAFLTVCSLDGLRNSQFS